MPRASFGSAHVVFDVPRSELWKEMERHGASHEHGFLPFPSAQEVARQRSEAAELSAAVGTWSVSSTAIGSGVRLGHQQSRAKNMPWGKFAGVTPAGADTFERRASGSWGRYDLTPTPWRGEESPVTSPHMKRLCLVTLASNKQPSPLDSPHLGTHAQHITDYKSSTHRALEAAAPSPRSNFGQVFGVAGSPKGPLQPRHMSMESNDSPWSPR